MNDPISAPRQTLMQQSRALQHVLQRYPTVARRTIVFVFCSVMSIAAWIALRGSPLPGSTQPLWSLPFWAKALLLAAMVLGLFGLFRLGGSFIRDTRALYRNPAEMRSNAVATQWYRYLNPLGPFYNLYLHRNLLRQLVWREVRQRYQGSWLGATWSLLTPLLMLSIYTFIFSVVLKTHFRDSQSPFEYGLTLFAGLIAFSLFSDSIAHAPAAIVSKHSFVKKVVFPLEIFPVVLMGSELVNTLISLLVLVIAMLLLLGALPLSLILIPLMLLPLIGYGLGLGWFFASLGVFVRDLNPFINIATRMLLYLSAVFYPLERVPEQVQHLLRLNPLLGIIENFRRVAMWNQAPDWPSWAILTALSFVVMLLGYAWFMKTKQTFADVL